MHFSIDRTVHTTAFDKPVVDHWLERKIAQTAAGSTEKDRSDDRPLQRRARYRLSYSVLHQVHSFQERNATSKLHSWHLSQQQDSSTRKFTCFGRASQATPKGPHFRGHLKYIGAGDLRDNALVGRSQSYNAFYHQNCMVGVGQSPNQVA